MPSIRTFEEVMPSFGCKVMDDVQQVQHLGYSFFLRQLRGMTAIPNDATRFCSATSSTRFTSR
jgi:hypothetical protein